MYIEQIKGVFKGYKDIDKVVLFGSRARNDFKKTLTLTWLYSPKILIPRL